jgi:cytochrome c556
MKFAFIIPSVAALALIGGTLATTGASQADSKKADGYSLSVAQSGAQAVSDKRRKLMGDMSKTRKSLTKAAKGGKIAAAQVAQAERIAADVKQLAALFGDRNTASDKVKGRAKPAIWEKMGDFKKRLAKLEKAAADGVKAAKAGDAKAVAAAMGDAGCGGCHKAYRGPKVK